MLPLLGDFKIVKEPRDGLTPSTSGYVVTSALLLSYLGLSFLVAGLGLLDVSKISYSQGNVKLLVCTNKAAPFPRQPK